MAAGPDRQPVRDARSRRRADETDVADDARGRQPALDPARRGRKCARHTSPGHGGRAAAGRRRRRPRDQPDELEVHRPTDRPGRGPRLRRRTRPARAARPHAAPLAGRRDHGTSVREAPRAGCDVSVLPATRHACRDERPTSIVCSSASAVPFDRCSSTAGATGSCRLGEIAAAEIEALSRGRLAIPIPIEIDEQLLDGWDLVVSIGQVVPHEVIGMANFTKNLVIGLGGAPRSTAATSSAPSATWRRSWAAPTTRSATRRRRLRPLHGAPVDVLWLLTVIQDTAGRRRAARALRRPGALREIGGAAYRAAAALARPRNIDVVPRASRSRRLLARSRRVPARPGSATRLSTAPAWRSPTAANSSCSPPASCASARTQRSMSSSAATATAAPQRPSSKRMADDPISPPSLGAAAHLIHGSSEGRFRITYCTDPDRGGLTPRRSSGSATAGVRWRRSWSGSASTARLPRALGSTETRSHSGTSPIPRWASGLRKRTVWPSTSLARSDKNGSPTAT